MYKIADDTASQINDDKNRIELVLSCMDELIAEDTVKRFCSILDKIRLEKETKDKDDGLEWRCTKDVDEIEEEHGEDESKPSRRLRRPWTTASKSSLP